jgi:single-strand DNA-binding protein
VSTYGAPGTRPRTEIHATRNGRHVVHQTAEFVAKHFTKGQRVAIVGSIQTRSWEDNDGGKHKAVEIVADSVYFADAKKESAAGSYAESAMTSEGFEVTDEDIPF